MSVMYSKVFQQIFDSSISEDHVVRHVFMDLLVLADRHGCVDMTLKAISRRTNVPLDMVTRCIDVLTQPDPTSRTDTEEGRRLVLLDEHRDWGWKIVNFVEYNAMRNEDARREYFREYKARQRANVQHKSTVSTKVHRKSTVSTNASTYLNTPTNSKQKQAASAFELPDWIAKDSWDGYEEMRRKVRKPMTDRARQMAVKELAGLQARGHPANAVLDQSTQHSWQGLFEIRPNGTNGNHQRGGNKFDELKRQIDEGRFDEEAGDDGGTEGSATAFG